MTVAAARRGIALAIVLLVAAAPTDARRKPVAGPSSARSSVAPALPDPGIDALLLGLAGEYEVRKQSRDALLARGKAITPRLIPLLESVEWEYRWEVVNVLGYLEDPQAVPALVARVVGDPNRHVRWRALWAVAVTDPRKVAAPALLRAELAGPEELRRWNAVVGLTMFDDAAVVPLVHERLASGDWWVRWEAVNALGRVHDARSSGLLAPLLESDGDSSVRREVTFVLGVICDARARELLASGLTDVDPQVRWRAAMGLGRCEDGAAEPLLRGRLDVEGDALVRTQLVEALARLARR